MPATERPYPLIGVNMDYIPATKNAGALNRLHAGYAESIYAAKGIPVLIPPCLKEEDLEELVGRLDGVVLSGCAFDMDPKRMGVGPHSAVQPMPSKREDADRMLCKMAMERQMPILAIAVGMHELNVLSGGSLYMHLPEDQPKAMPHKEPGGGVHRHAVILTPGTRVAGIYGTEETLVNSFHHQAVQMVGSGLRISATSADGIIEAIEAEDPDWYFVGVQWHPHSETASALDMQLFESLIEAASVKKEFALRIAA